jgi:hypothetical protein
MSKEQISEHDRIKKNTQSIGSINRRLGQIEQVLGSGVKQWPGLAARSNYTFVFGANPFEFDGAVAATAAGTWVQFNACDNFYENTTKETKTVTVTIKHNSGGLNMVVDIDGTEVTEIEDGKTKTIIVDIPAGKSLHANKNGEYLA